MLWENMDITMKNIHIKALACAAVGAAVFAGCATKPELRVYTWKDYVSPDVIEAFEERHGCRVLVDTFDSNETMIANLKSGGSGYDIITPSSYCVPLLAREGLVAELDHSKLPNVRANFDPSFADQILDPSFTYSVPYAVTYTGFCYLKDKIPAGSDVASWSILSSPALKGKVTLLDDMREVIGAGLMSLGYSVNSHDAKEIDAAVEQVRKWSANVRKFDAESYKSEVASGATWVGHGYSTDAAQVMRGDPESGVKPRPDIGFALPREGFTIAFDEMVLSAAASNPDLAYAFMNEIYSGETAKANMDYIMGPMPVKPGIALLDDNYRKAIIPDAGTLRNGQVLRAVDDDADAEELYKKAWNTLKGIQ